VAGLLVAVGFLSVGPVSRSFSVWACGFFGPILSRAEAAAGYLVIAKARRVVAAHGFDVDRNPLSVSFTPEFTACDTELSLSDLRRRLEVLQAMLMDLPRHALRLLRRIDRRSPSAPRRSPRPDACRSISLHEWRKVENRVERPPDKIERPAKSRLSVPSSVSPPSGFRAGGEDGWRCPTASTFSVLSDFPRHCHWQCEENAPAAAMPDQASSLSAFFLRTLNKSRALPSVHQMRFPDNQNRIPYRPG